MFSYNLSIYFSTLKIIIMKLAAVSGVRHITSCLKSESNRILLGSTGRLNLLFGFCKRKVASTLLGRTTIVGLTWDVNFG